jgi:polyisoprenoid-binding protein YceI
VADQDGNCASGEKTCRLSFLPSLQEGVLFVNPEGQVAIPVPIQASVAWVSGAEFAPDLKIIFEPFLAAVGFLGTLGRASMKHTLFLLPLAASALLVSCGNPADNTVSASIADAVEKSGSSSGGGIRYEFLPTSEINFVGSKVTGSHDGGFKTFSGHFTILGDEPVGDDHRVEIDMDSTWSDSERLTRHLKNEDFFHVEQFPTSTFEATSIARQGGDAFSISGNFTLHGVTKNITFPATVSRDGETIHIGAEFDINRKDFGIVYAGMTDDLIRDEVVIKLNLHAAPALEEAAPEA